MVQIIINRNLSIVPMESWLNHWGTSPEDLLQGAFNGKSTHIFIAAWEQRIIDEKHSEFARAMLRVSAKK